MVDFLLACVGLVFLLLSGDALVRGAVNLSLRLGVPALVVGLTIVGFGTSAPELLVSVQAVLRDAPGLALGNVVGSNIANILLILGLPAMFVGMKTAAADTRRSYWIMIAATLVFIAGCFLGPIGRLHGLVFLALLAAILGRMFVVARRGRTAAPEDVEGADPAMPGWRIALYLAVGLIGLPLGADLLVDAATRIARDFGISETVIGLTLVAVGTSLPELATTAVAAFRRHAEVALGNVIGSNFFNLLGIIGITALVAPIPVDPEFLRLDLWVMLAASALLAPFVVWRRDISRLAGAGLTALYGGYLAVLLLT
jgi:cation:H+ antiporter